MPKRKLKRSQKASDDEIESERPGKHLRKQNLSKEIGIKNISFSKKNDNVNSDICNLEETFDSAIRDTYYDSFSNFLRTYHYYFDKSGDHQNIKAASGNESNECGISMIDIERRLSEREVPHLASSSYQNVVNKETETNLRIIPVPSKSSQIVLLEHSASLTLHGYVKVNVLYGNARVFGCNLKEGGEAIVFSTEGTGLKKVFTSIPKYKSDVKALKKEIKKLTCHEKTVEWNVEQFIDDIGPSSVVLCVSKILLPSPLQFLELYYPTALQARWISSESEKEQNLKLCSTQQEYTIDLSGDFNKLSKQINKVISNPNVGHCILVSGEKNMGKSTLMRYLMNSSLNKVKEVYFLDTDPGQTEYTPPGVVSLFRVTKPLLGPPFTHQKRPLKMIFTGSITPGTSPKLHEASVGKLMKYFNDNFQKKTLFVNTMGWVQGVGEMCQQNIKHVVKPTIEIQLVAPDLELSLTEEVGENNVTVFKVPSKAPPRKKASSYSAVELRNFNIMAYFGQCQKPYLPVSLINSFHPVCISWDKIALFVMGKKVPPHRLVEAIHCSIVALCHVKLSHVLKSDNPDFPMTLYDEPICECLGFGLVRASDETNRLYYIVTPLELDELKNVNALVKGDIMIPNEIFLKQTILNVPLPFTNRLQVAKTPGLKSVPKRAFRNASTSFQTP